MPFLIVGATTTLLLIGAGWCFSGLVLHPRLFGYDETWDIEVGKGRIDPAWWESLPAEETWIDSPFGYKIHTLWVPNAASKQTVILVHGITYTLWGSVKYMPLFWNRGFNVLLIDNRYHGKSGGPNCTFGFRERWDVKACVDWVCEQTGQDSIVGLHGESMGAAIVLQAAAVDRRLRFVIADCAPADLSEELETRLSQDHKLPVWLFVPIASLVTRLRAGFWFSQVSPIHDIARVEVPILFVHGQDDDYVSPQMAQRLYDAKVNGLRRLYLAPHATHAQSFWVNKAAYDQIVDTFLKDAGIVEKAHPTQPEQGR
jgi:pimeloyl-ACP methyl ester carboxylesterase